MQVSKWRFLVAVVLLLGSSFMWSCRPDDDGRAFVDAPGITFSPGGVTENITVSENASVPFIVVFSKGTDGENLAKIRYTRSVGSTILESLDTNINLATFTWNAVKVLTPTRALGNGEREVQVFRFAAIDADGRLTAKDLAITIESNQTPRVSKIWENVVFTNANPYFSTLTIGNGTLNEDQANAAAESVDLTYYFSGASTVHSFVSPRRRALANESDPLFWANGFLATKYRTTNASASDFVVAGQNLNLIAGIHDAGTLADFFGETDGDRVGSLNIKPGAVLAFQGLNGKKGLILVKQVSNGSLTVDIVAEN